MAKAKNKTTEQDATTAPDAPTTIKVQGILFPVSPRYSEGHPLTAQEAAVLNQTLYENLRNNFATHIRKSVEESAKAAGVEHDTHTLSEDEVSTLQAKFVEYAAAYTFAAPRAGRTPVDPLQREMRAIAKERILAALAAKNVSVKSLPEGKMDEFIATAIANRPEIKDEAQRRLDARKAAADDILDL